jgi:serine/threonine protein kinase
MPRFFLLLLTVFALIWAQGTAAQDRYLNMRIRDRESGLTFRTTEFLDEGKWARTYKAQVVPRKGEDYPDGTTYAIKLFVNSHPTEEMFQKEADSLSKAGLLRSKSFNHRPPYLAMLYVRGERLGIYLKNKGKIDRRLYEKLKAAILKAIDELHAKGITHHDIHPGNVLIEEQGRSIVAHLIDFDSSELLEGNQYAKNSKAEDIRQFDERILPHLLSHRRH